MKSVQQKSNLQEIPGVGPSISKDFNDLGICSVSDLKKKDPEVLYQRLMRKRNQHIDRCVLYVFRCAVYYAENKIHDTELLKWWNWKDNNGETV
jgi:nucleotidyltransferase/DNA polymerase involved in DNA repair